MVDAVALKMMKKHSVHVADEKLVFAVVDDDDEEEEEEEDA